jgi:serine/threonine protein kinase
MLPVSPCPEPDRLRHLALGQASPLEVESFAQHLEQCPTCPARLESLLQGDTLRAAAREGAAMNTPPVTVDNTLIEQLQRLAPSPDSTQIPQESDLKRLLALSKEKLACGPMVPGYSILQELGRGGMGVVYLAREIALDRTVALKMILHGDYAGAEELRRFRIEAEAVARLQHPNIVQIHAIGEHNGLPYCALEYCAGGSLKQHQAGRPLKPAQAAQLVETLARAMDAAHKKQIIHRDLKPQNVLLTETGEAKITDFGLAKKLDGEPGASARGGLTQTGDVLGTPSYMPPEQARGDRVKQQGELTATRAKLLRLLRKRFKKVPRKVEARIAATTNL